MARLVARRPLGSGMQELGEIWRAPLLVGLAVSRERMPPQSNSHERVGPHRIRRDWIPPHRIRHERPAAVVWLWC